MPMIHITRTGVEALPTPFRAQVDYFDDKLTGFGVRVSATCKSYFAMRRVNGRTIRVKIDTADKITAEGARKRAQALLAAMGEGIDPNESKREAQRQMEEERKQQITLQDALDEYVGKGTLKPRTISTYKDLLRLYLADWLLKPAADINRDMVKARHADIASGNRDRRKLTGNAENDPRRAAADNCMRTLRAVLNYAFDDEEGGVYANPVSILSSRKRKAWFKVDRRRTLVKNSDLPAWHKAVTALDNNVMRDYLLFLLFTGLRRQEAATLTWKQVDFDEGCFTIPDTKNKQPHTLPMSDYLRALLTSRRAESTSPYVFPGNGKTGFIVEPRRAIDAVTTSTGIAFSCHDLRRTFATIAESLDLSGYTVKALLNHKQQLGDVTGGYIILNVDRLREPMQRVTDAILERIKIQHGQVVNIRARA